MKDIVEAKSLQVVVTGLVQGVGFRPFVFRIAQQYALTGWVQNTNENVRIQLTGKPAAIDGFLHDLKTMAPPASVIEAITTLEMETSSFSDFSIRHSHDLSNEITEISPDIAVCEDCLQDIMQAGTRKDYGFVNCTNCGPRFTIIRDLPYDRAKTTMADFRMCPECQGEYDTISDRRFHAQPTACDNCGPHYALYTENKLVADTMETILSKVTACLDHGGVMMMKGLGGMHLACDAFQESAVERLRDIKNREGKPFAVMFPDLETLKQYTEVDAVEEQSLSSWKRPIVLLRKKTPDALPGLAMSLNAGLDMLGVMLPYMPIHYLLFQALKTPAIVLTSGNFSSEPILIDNQLALEQFSPHVDAILLHNRDIYNRTDDSVVRVIGGKARLFRRSRGYVPAPVRTALNTEGILAFGAELTNCFCIGKGKKAFLSQHIGDLQGLETTTFYENTITQFLQLFRLKPDLLAVDMHPAYISTRTGLHFGDIPLVQVQHHHAHIAACMAEHGLDENVIGIALDGTGYGTDGNTWGSEFFVCDLTDFERFTHFEYMALPGGDLATEEPWRMAFSLLYKIYRERYKDLEMNFIQQLDPEKARLIAGMIDKGINCPLTCGAGRLFDAVAALLGLVHIASFQAEGPMRLEAIVKADCTDYYEYTAGKTLKFDKTITGIVADLQNGLDQASIATKFHNTIIIAIFDSANAIRQQEGISKVVLSGGVFQNKYLLEGVTKILQNDHFEVYSHAAVPTNDGGIALGQLAVASKRRELQCV